MGGGRLGSVQFTPNCEHIVVLQRTAALGINGHLVGALVSQPTQLSLEFALRRSTRASIDFSAFHLHFAMFVIVEFYFRLFVALLDSVSVAENCLLIVIGVQAPSTIQ
jgi:hypothetical protein